MGEYEKMTCKNLCERLYSKTFTGNNGNRSHYGSGEKYCSMCEIYLFHNGVYCPCCGIALRVTPTSRKTKERLIKSVGGYNSMNQFTALLLTGLMLVSVSMIALSQQAMADNGKGGACVIGIGGPCNNNEKSNTGGGSHHSSHHHEGSSFSGNSISVQSKHGNRLIQIPSNVTDFTNEDNSSLILVSVHNTKDIVSPYDIKGVVENVSNKTLIGVWIIATLYDAKKNAIIERQSPATISGSADSNIEPGQSKPFDIPFLKPDLNGQATPVFFKLGFRWL